MVLPKRVQEPSRGQSRAGDAVAAGAGCAAGWETSGGRGEECAAAVDAARVDAGALVGGRARALSGRRAPRRGQRLGPRCWLANFLSPWEGLCSGPKRASRGPPETPRSDSEGRGLEDGREPPGRGSGVRWRQVREQVPPGLKTALRGGGGRARERLREAWGHGREGSMEVPECRGGSAGRQGSCGRRAGGEVWPRSASERAGPGPGWRGGRGRGDETGRRRGCADVGRFADRPPFPSLPACPPLAWLCMGAGAEPFPLSRSWGGGQAEEAGGVCPRSSGRLSLRHGNGGALSAARVSGEVQDRRGGDFCHRFPFQTGPGRTPCFLLGAALWLGDSEKVSFRWGVCAFPGRLSFPPAVLRFEVKESRLLRISRAAHYTLFTEHSQEFKRELHTVSSRLPALLCGSSLCDYPNMLKFHFNPPRIAGLEARAREPSGWALWRASSLLAPKVPIPVDSQACLPPHRGIEWEPGNLGFL